VLISSVSPSFFSTFLCIRLLLSLFASSAPDLTVYSFCPPRSPRPNDFALLSFFNSLSFIICSPHFHHLPTVFLFYSSFFLSSFVPTHLSSFFLCYTRPFFSVGPNRQRYGDRDYLSIGLNGVGTTGRWRQNLVSDTC
jgi:hypothetical protein